MKKRKPCLTHQSLPQKDTTFDVRKMEERGSIENPSFFSSLRPYQRTQQTNSLFHSLPLHHPHDQTLALDFSRLSLSFPATHHHPPPPEFPAGNSWHHHHQEVMTNHHYSNVGLMRTQNGCFLGAQSGPHGDFLVGPVSGVNVFGGGVDLGLGVNPRLNFDGVFQRGSGFGQAGPSFGQNNYDPFAQTSNLTSRNEVVSFPRFSQNVDFHEEDFVARKCEYIDKSLYELKNLRGGFSIRDFKGVIVLLAKDQSWSKVLQTKIEEQSVLDNEFVVSEVVDCVCDLMKNQSGSYFIQKLFGVCNEEQRTRIIEAASRISFDLVNVCLCSHGAKTVQILMENLNTPQQISLVISAICPGAVVLSSDQHGQHVIRCCLTKFSYEFHKLLLDKIIQNCIQVATNKCGCCVLQSCVEYSHGKPRKRLIDEIIANAIRLAQDPYGNYVVQHLAGLGVPEITADLIQHLRGKFTSLSCNKFASNVVEKFLLEAGEEYTTTIIEDLLENPQAAAALLVNPYGNFVIQTALTVSKGVVFEKLLDLILIHAPSIKNNTYAEKIFAWFDKRNISLGKYMKN